MPLPVTFATLATGNQPASLLDQNFAAVANMATTYCTATGTNTILLSVAPNQPTPTGYANGQQFSFLVPATNTGPVTIQVGSLAAIPLRAAGAALGAGALIAGTTCNVVVSGNGTTADVVGGSGTASGAFLPLAGGTLSGALTINNAGNSFTVNKPASGTGCNILGQTAAATRWVLQLGNNATETGTGNAGSDFGIIRYNDAGTGIDTPLTITRSTGQVAIKGTSTNDSAAAGFVGEYIQSIIASPGVTLTTATNTNITNISLTAGDWDVSADIWVSVGTGAATLVAGGTGTVSAAFPGVGAGGRVYMNTTFAASALAIVPIATARFSLAATTTVYLVAAVIFPSGTTTCYGRIGARRMR